MKKSTTLTAAVLLITAFSAPAQRVEEAVTFIEEPAGLHFVFETVASRPGKGVFTYANTNNGDAYDVPVIPNAPGGDGSDIGAFELGASAVQLKSAKSSVSEAAGTATVTATRTGYPAGPVSVKLSTADGTAIAGSDYAVTQTTLSWADGETGDKTFAIPIVNDGVVERTETFSVTLSSSDPAALGATTTEAITIVDDDGLSVGVLSNISTRAQVGTGNNVLIAGFIVEGSAAKKVLIRAAGPSLTPFGLSGALANPRLELHDASTAIGRNDNWQTTQLGGAVDSDQAAEIQSSGVAPTNPAEAALIATLEPGSYTAIVSGVGDTEGIALVEVYDLTPNNGSELANISTRGLIQAGDKVMIGGFIVTGHPAKVIIRATGPSLTASGINNALPNPKLALHDANGTLAGNDNWQTTQLGGIISSDQSGAIQSSGVAPTDPAESAIIATLAPGAYTAIAQDVNGATGVGLLEVYKVQEEIPRSDVNQDVEVLKNIVQTESRKAGTAAVIFGMWSGQKEVLTEALGESTPGVPATTDMHYRIGGITETFLVTLLFQLVEEGRIDLDTKISRWFPELPAADQVTVRMLAANTAGYLDYVTMQDWLDRLLSDPLAPFTDEELIEYAVREGKMRFSPPGSSWAYSHTEYVILGQVIQRATGKSIKALYEHYLLNPLELRNTRLPTDARIQLPVLHAHMLDRGTYEDSTAWTPSWAMSYGGMTSTVRDLGRWGPIFGKGLLVSPASHKEITSPGSVQLKSNPPALYFAHGFIVANGWYLQNPDFNGYAGAFAYNPAHDVTLVVVSTKSARPEIDPAAIHIMRELVRYVTPESPLNF